MPLFFYVESIFPAFIHRPHAIIQAKSVCVVCHYQCVCSYSYLYYLHEDKLYRCAQTCILPPSRPGTQPLVMLMCGFFGRSHRNHYFLVLVMRALASSIHIQPVALVAYQVILGPGLGQFREFEFPRVHTRIRSWDFFLRPN